MNVLFQFNRVVSTVNFRHAFLVLFSLLLLNIPGCDSQNKIHIGFLVPSEPLSTEAQAALDWLKHTPPFIPTVVNLQKETTPGEQTDLLWLHIPDSASLREWDALGDKLNFLKSYYDTGGKLFFTDFAALLPHRLGMEPVSPEVRVLEIKNDWLFDKKGLQSFRGHPVFEGLFGGTFIWDAYQDHRLPTVGYFDAAFPAEGKVVATEKSYITIHGDRRLMVEYQGKAGQLLSIGGLIYFAQKNHLRYRLEKFVSNCFLYLHGELDGSRKTYWISAENRPKEFPITTKAPELKHPRVLDPALLSDLTLSRDQATPNYYDISGRRALIMGKEPEGIDEFWVHPFRVLRDFHAGLLSGDSLIWLNDLPCKIEVRPESFRRIYSTPEGELVETLFPALEQAGGWIQYHLRSSHPVRLIIHYRSDLRWMWPYDEYAIGDIYFGYDSLLQALHLKDSAGDLYAIIGSDSPPRQHREGRFSQIRWQAGQFIGRETELNQVYFAGEYELNSENQHTLTLVVAGSNEGEQRTVENYRRIVSDPLALYQTAVDHYRQLLQRSVEIESPDAEFNQLWKWAIVGTDRFVADTPPLGTGLLAGYSTTARGWDGRHKISGRPGYAWYFGRDSEWSGFAIDNYGDFEVVRKQLQFLQKFQDLNGKIFHEISTSGVVHYDAADATPLYIILAAHYLRASDDLPFIRQSWLHLKKAMDYLYATDTDHDLLIENTNEGHGWVEGGKLWGAHTTFYLATLWAQTLADAAYLAHHVGLDSLAAKYSADCKTVRKILNTDFWNEAEQFFYYGKMADGSYNPEKTVLPAVAMYFELLDDAKTPTMLRNFAGNGFSPDWGVRIVSSESPLFKPYGYHYGSVWPLFTGWTALGEFAYGNSLQGFTHIMNTLYIKNHWALGFVEEVMHGAEYKPSGVCPHQCWSETNILHPAIHGMIGWKPEAPENRALLTPRFPLHWDSVTVRHLRIGESLMEFQLKRSNRKTIYRFILREGSPLELRFAPEIPLGMSISGATLDGERLSISSETRRGLLADTITFNLVSAHEVVIHHSGGIGMIPELPRPEEGDVSRGYRIIAAEWEPPLWRILLEGKAGSQKIFKFRLFDGAIRKLSGALLLPDEGTGIRAFKVDFPYSEKPYVQKTVSIELQ
ncbi:MAG: hypothetical protein Kow0042_06390 [Calditrichia bacterium]